MNIAARVLLCSALLLSATAGAQTRPAERGKQLFDHWCSACHKPLGEFVSSVPGTTALQNKYKGAIPAALEQRNDLKPDYVRLIIRQGILSMPFFRKTELSDDDVAAIGAYLARP
jgi:(+)-pinoresinol hydroxylase